MEGAELMGWRRTEWFGDKDLDSQLAEAERALREGEISDAAYHMRVERAIDNAPPSPVGDDTPSGG
jgi:hypothetical protein